MFPSRDDLERIAYATSGDLTAVPFPVLLVAYAAMRRSLLLQVSHGPVIKVVTVVDGIPVDCRSNLLQDTLGRYLIGSGQLTEPQVAKLESEASATGRTFEELLAATGWIEGDALARSQQQHLARKLLDAFAWEEGSFQCANLDTPPESIAKLKVPQLLLMGVEKLAPPAQVSAWIASHAVEPLYLHQQPVFPPGELRLNKQQQTLVESLRAGKRIEELDPTGADPKTWRFLYALGLMGMLTIEPPVQPERRDTSTVQVPAAVPAPGPAAELAPGPAPELVPGGGLPPTRPDPRPGLTIAPIAVAEPVGVPVTAAQTVTAAPAVPAQATAERRREILELYQRFRALDAFDLLRARPEAAPEEIERSYLAYGERTAPWTIGTGEVEGKARELFLAGARAFAELSDPERRSSIQARRLSPIDKAADALKSARDAFKIQTVLLDPRSQHAKGVAMIAGKRYPEALELLQYAADCDPQNAIYRAELAHCHWLSQPQARARGSVRDLEEATRLDPACGLAFLYLGEILAWLDKIEEARVALKRAAQLLLPDRRGLEMLKALPPPGKKGGKLGKWF